MTTAALNQNSSINWTFKALLAAKKQFRLDHPNSEIDDAEIYRRLLSQYRVILK